MDSHICIYVRIPGFNTPVNSYTVAWFPHDFTDHPPFQLLHEVYEFKDMVAVLKWSCAAINRYWRTVYGSGIWLHRAVASQVVRDGWAWLDTQHSIAIIFVISFGWGTILTYLK